MAQLKTLVGLSEDLAAAMNLKKKDAREITEKLFSLIKEHVATGGKVTIKEFGRFEKKHRAAREARNPQTGEKMMTTEKDVLGFKSAYTYTE